jgi:hypothetical protein
MLAQLARTLTTAAAEVRNVCQERTEEEYNGYTSMITPRILDTEALDVMPLGVSVDISQQSAPPKPTVCPYAAPLADKTAVLAQLDVWKRAGLSLQAMATQLNTANVPTFSGTGAWQKGTIGNLLTKRQAAPVA